MSQSSDHPAFASGILNGFHLLEADAGTGKTWTIACLVVRAIVESCLPPDKILVVTFTNAAASELQERIHLHLAQLHRALTQEGQDGGSQQTDPFCQYYVNHIKNPARTLRDLRQALSRFDEMPICTIHSMCQKIIQTQGLSTASLSDAGQPRLADDTASQRSRHWWRTHVICGEKTLIACLGAAGLSPERLAECLRLYESHPEAQFSPAGSDWADTACRFIELRQALLQALQNEQQALLDWISNRKLDRRRWRITTMASALAEMRDFCESPYPHRLPDAFRKFSTQRFLLSPDQTDWPRAIPAWCDKWEAFLPRLYALPWSIAAQLARTPLSYTERLERDGFDALLYVVHSAITDPLSGAALRQTLRRDFPLAFVDECQDTDPLQWSIFKHIYLHNSGDSAAQGLVLVGDPKQSIYAFRGGDVYTYLNTHASHPTRHQLTKNHRSVPEIVSAVHALFEKSNAFRIPGITYRPNLLTNTPLQAPTSTELTCTSGNLEKKGVHVLLMRKTTPVPRTSQNQSHPSPSVQTTLVSLVGVISALIYPVSGTQKLSDIAILVDTHQQGEWVKTALSQAKIPCTDASRESVWHSLECQELARIIAAIDRPTDRGTIQSALHTSLLSDWLCHVEPATLTETAIERFLIAQKHWETLGAEASLRRMITDCCIAKRLAMHRQGERRLTNLLQLLEKIGAAPTKTPYQLFIWMHQQQGDPDAELRLETNANRIKISTVHRSKGLQYAVVFIPFVWMASHSPTGTPLQYHRYAQTQWQTVLDLDERPDNPARQAEQQEHHAEATRKLYVALTRACSQLFIFHWEHAKPSDPLSHLLLAAPTSETQEISLFEAFSSWEERARRWNMGSTAIHIHQQEDNTQQPFPNDQGPPPSQRLTRRMRTNTPQSSWSTTHFSAWSWMKDQEDKASTEEHLPLPHSFDNAPLPPAYETDAPFSISTERTLPATSQKKRSITTKFPLGRVAGQLLHQLLEKIDFRSPAQPELIEHHLKHSLCSATEKIPTEELALWLDAISTHLLPTRPPCTLRSLAPHQLQRELSFQLATSASQRETKAIAAIISSAFPESHCDLPNFSWHGFLNGTIDLVLENQGRYSLLDWKSHFLGEEPEHYHTAAVEKTVSRYNYQLQLILYTLALHRILQRHLPNYRYEEHFEGAHCVFIRGIAIPHPPLSPHAQAVERSPSYTIRPPLALITALDHYLGYPCTPPCSPRAGNTAIIYRTR